MIRLSRQQDLTLLEEIERSASQKFHDYSGILQTGLEPVLPKALAQAAFDNGTLWIADVEDQAAGFLAAHSLKNGLHIDELSVAFDFQNRGLGKNLISAALQEAKNRKLHFVSLTTDQEIPWNYPFYKSIGFNRIELQDCPQELAEILQHDIQHSSRPENRIALVYRLDQS